MINQFQYSATGALTRLVYGHGLPKERTYDLDGRMTQTHDHAFLGHNYDYNANDELVSIGNWSRPQYNQDFGYDALSRLTGITSPSGNQSFAFDANGNRTHHQWLSNEAYLVAPGSNRTLSSDLQFTYDGRGNRTSQSWGGSTATYQYDSFNRLSAVTRDVPSTYRNPNDVSRTYPAGTTTYTVNALGQRVAKSGPLGSSRFVYGGQNTLMSEQVNGQWTDHIWMGGEPIGLVRGGQLYFVHADRLGRPEVVSHPDDHARWIAANHAYDRAVVGNSLGAYNLGLPGQYFDAETGHWYNGFRDYDGRTGSYLQSDPIGLAGGLNTYAYVRGNPISLIDPLGLDPCVCKTSAPDKPSGRMTEGPFTQAEADRRTMVNVNNNQAVSTAQSISLTIFGGGLAHALPRLGWAAVGASVTHAMGSGSAMSERDIVRAGESVTTEFFNHGDHFQMVKERFDPNGNSMGRGILESCHAGF